MLKLKVSNETSQLKSVILGVAKSVGKPPSIDECYDPKSLEHIKNSTYPTEMDMIKELNEFKSVLEKYDVEVLTPELIQNYNQIFTRDIAFVIEDKLVLSNIVSARQKEIKAINNVVSSIDQNKILIMPENCHIEGGDVILNNDYIFIGIYSGEDYSEYITARTNIEAANFIEQRFPNKKIKTFELRKSNTDAKNNALHLDCCFQPIGSKKAILHPGGFLIKAEYEWLVNFFGKENIFETTQQEMYDMNCNIFSISENIIVSESKFTRLNTWLTCNGFIVETIKYSEIAKQEGLLRCSTLPLIRK